MRLVGKAWLVAAFLAISMPLCAQYQGSRVIQGEVKFPNEKAVGPGYYVALESDASGGIITSQTDAQGKFTFSGLVAVRYRVRVRAPEFEESTQEVDLSTTPFAMLRFVLKSKPGHEPPPAPLGIVTVLPKEMPSEANKEFRAGMDAFQAAQFAKSIPHFKRSGEIYDKYAPTFYYLGGAYASTGNCNDAKEALKKSIALNDKAPEAYSALGTCELQQLQFADAERNFRSALNLVPDAFDTNFQLARALLALRKPDEALSLLQRALKADPMAAKAHVLMGNAMLQLNRPDEAIKEYREGIRLSPKSPIAEAAEKMISKLEAAGKNK